MKHIFLINSFTVKDKREKLLNKIVETCKDMEIDYGFEFNTVEKSTEDLLEKYKDSEYIIFAVGGDGMINRVLNKIIGTKNILGIIPFGTGNDTYKTVVAQCNQEFNPVDVVQVNNKYFINVGCWGIDAEIANNSKIIKSKLIPKSQRFNASVINSFFKYKGYEMDVTINDETISGKFTTVALCNGMYYGNGYKIGPNSLLNSGYIDVYSVPLVNRIKMMSLIASTKNGKHVNSELIKSFKTNSLIIKSNTPIKGNIDGEEIESTEFNVNVIPGGITVYNNPTLVNRIIGK